jgi:Arc/MetJ-type ribon-helix-helix transcriptional regulator
MKQKISITVEEETIDLLERMVEEGRFRSISHALEYGFKQFAREEKHGTKSI